jgi:hypothetical protein
MLLIAVVNRKEGAGKLDLRITTRKRVRRG